MATIAFVHTEHPGNSHMHFWEALITTSLDGAPCSIPGASDRCVQVMGTFGTATVTLQGSNDGGNTWATLTDFQDADLAITAAGMYMVAEAPLAIRPLVTVADGTTDLDVYLFSRGTR